ncbi:paired box protein Pax-2a [Trichonephila inaurata madagascariensis]|uniref:Paired box protein Pax-2a n=1 Tax=Trichonephila inaurata madagascariensis TaxID=2747483 RepID=A0A8X6YJN7_9ARAC|nr:paired box protein Pax-2a [Trichonephila inaurata madagascariensis]
MLHVFVTSACRMFFAVVSSEVCSRSSTPRNDHQLLAPSSEAPSTTSVSSCLTLLQPLHAASASLDPYAATFSPTQFQGNVSHTLSIACANQDRFYVSYNLSTKT